jgi:hypothetical protein
MTFLAVVFVCFTPAAGATALCEDEPVSEPVEGACGLAYESGTMLLGYASNVEIEGLITDKCKQSAILGEPTEEPTEEGSPLKGLVTAFAFTECTCPTEALNLPYDSSLSWTEGANGTMTLKASEEPAIEIDCLFGQECVYGANSLTTSVTGGNPAKIAINEELVLIEGEGFFCEKTTQLSTTYTLTIPQGGQANVANQQTPVFLCKTAGTVDQQNPCEVPAYPIPTTLEAAKEGNFIFELKYEDGNNLRAKTVTCTSASLIAATYGIGDNQDRPTWPLRAAATSLPFTNCTNENNTNCTVEAKRLYWELRIDATTGNQGSLAMGAISNGPPAIFIKCQILGLPECTYSTDWINGTIANGAPAKLAIANVSLTTYVAGPAGCRGIVWKTGNYKFTKPEAGNPLAPQMWVRRRGVG